MTCAKKVVTCTIKSADGRMFQGENACGNPQKTCPRLPGEGYAKCKEICQQSGHAEEMALKAAKGHDLTGAVVYIHGIDHYCKSCQQQLFAAGVTALKLL